LIKGKKKENVSSPCRRKKKGISPGIALGDHKKGHADLEERKKEPSREGEHLVP